MVVLLYVIAAVAIVQGIISLIDGYRAASHMENFRPRRVSKESVVVFCPCRGVDDGLDKNVRSLLEQDYENYEVTFVVESEEDPAYGVLAGMGIKAVVAGRAVNRGQKVHNLACAVAQCAFSPDVYVFCDSDARYPPHWLSTLIAPLKQSVVTTGYRWYLVQRFHLPALFRSAWNASVVSMLGEHNRNFAWGGSMAMRRETFEGLKILEAWEGSVSDDYSVTRAAQKAGAEITFVPECLVPSYGECTWSELIEFTTRQIIITRVYHPRLWRIGFLGHIIFNTAFWSMVVVKPQFAAALFLLSMWKAAVRLLAVQSVLPDPSLFKLSWFYILSPPLVALIYLYNIVRSALGTEIVWRQIHYKLISPNKTRVVGGSGANES